VSLCLSLAVSLSSLLVVWCSTNAWNVATAEELEISEQVSTYCTVTLHCVFTVQKPSTDTWTLCQQSHSVMVNTTYIAALETRSNLMHTIVTSDWVITAAELWCVCVCLVLHRHRVSQRLVDLLIYSNCILYTYLGNIWLDKSGFGFGECSRDAHVTFTKLHDSVHEYGGCNTMRC